MANFKESQKMKGIAKAVINSRDEVRHVDVNEVLFLEESETVGRAAARCYSLKDKPIQLFTDKRFSIVFYESMIDYFTKDQRAILMLHELMHIPEIGDKLVKHNVEDFYEVLSLGIDWNCLNAKVPKIIEEKDHEKEKRKQTKANGVRVDSKRKRLTRNSIKSRT